MSNFNYINNKNKNIRIEYSEEYSEEEEEEE